MADNVIPEHKGAVNWVGPAHPGFIAEVEAQAPANLRGVVGRFQMGDKVLVGYSMVRA